MVFKVTEEDVERASLDKSDIGRWAFIVTGCWQLYDTERSARSAYDFVFRGER